jgi:hypothetical protein
MLWCVVLSVWRTEWWRVSCRVVMWFVAVVTVDRVLCNLPNSQQGFLNFVVKPIYTAVVETFPKGQVCVGVPICLPCLCVVTLYPVVWLSGAGAGVRVHVFVWCVCVPWYPVLPSCSWTI